MTLNDTIGVFNYISKKNKSCPFDDENFEKSYDLFDHLEQYHTQEMNSILNFYKNEFGDETLSSNVSGDKDDDKEDEDNDISERTHIVEYPYEGDKEPDSGKVGWQTYRHLPEGAESNTNYEDVSASTYSKEYEIPDEEDSEENEEESNARREYKNLSEGQTYYKGKRGKGKNGPKEYRRRVRAFINHITKKKDVEWVEHYTVVVGYDKDEKPLEREMRTYHSLYNYSRKVEDEENPKLRVYTQYIVCREDGLTHFPEEAEDEDNKQLIGIYISAAMHRNKNGIDNVPVEDSNALYRETLEHYEEDKPRYRELVLRQAETFAEKSENSYAADYDPDANMKFPETLNRRSMRSEEEIERDKVIARLRQTYQRRENDKRHKEMINELKNPNPQPFKLIDRKTGEVRIIQPGTNEYDHYNDKWNSLHPSKDKDKNSNKRKSTGLENISGDYVLIMKFSYERDVDDTVKELIERQKYMGTIGTEYKCPFDRAIFINKNGLGYHLLTKHLNEINDIVDSYDE